MNVPFTASLRTEFPDCPIGIHSGKPSFTYTTEAAAAGFEPTETDGQRLLPYLNGIKKNLVNMNKSYPIFDDLIEDHS